MPPAPDGIPWAVWAMVVIVLALIANLPSTIVAIRSRTELKEAKSDIKEVKGQVQNTHVSNLREDLDVISRQSANAATDAKLSLETSNRTERLVEDVLKSMRAVEHSIDRRDKLHVDAMEEIAEDVAETRETLAETRATLKSHIQEIRKESQ